VRACGYCGLRAANRQVERYRMRADEILACARDAAAWGWGTVVLQSGEDYGLTTSWIADLVRRIKNETGLAVTLSFGERPEEDLAAWREAGADRYLLRFETSDEALYKLIHPDLPGRRSDRMALLRTLQKLGYEAGSGIMVGMPGQTFASVADDIDLFRGLDLDMIGIGPYIAHPETPLGDLSWARQVPAGEQIPGDELTVYKVVALTRLVCPEANIPSTTALATINKVDGRETGLQRGANIVMPNLTPPEYRVKYEIYPDKACVNETAEMCRGCLSGRVESIGRVIGRGPGGRRRATGRVVGHGTP
jgi:biotin synthase